MSYDNVLKDKKMDFQTFKTLYGYNDSVPRNVKYGGELVTVDNKNYTITNVPVSENEARKRLLAGTLSSN